MYDLITRDLHEMFLRKGTYSFNTPTGWLGIEDQVTLEEWMKNKEQT